MWNAPQLPVLPRFSVSWSLHSVHGILLPPFLPPLLPLFPLSLVTWAHWIVLWRILCFTCVCSLAHLAQEERGGGGGICSGTEYQAPY